MKDKVVDHLIIISGTYPSPGNPNRGTFVQELARGMVRAGVAVTVVSPVPLHKGRKESLYPRDESAPVTEGQFIRVLRPRFLSISAWQSLRFLGRWNPSRLTLLAYIAAVRRAASENHLSPSAVYGHFLYPAGVAAVRVGSQLGVPSFVGVGEGEFWTLKRFGVSVARHDLREAGGFIAHNSDLRAQLMSVLRAPPERVRVFPNGVDLKRFFPRGKAEARRRFGLPEDAFLVLSIGNFLFKKGIVRVGEAIRGLEGIYGVFAGSGPLPPEAPNIAFCQKVGHQDIPWLLSAGDVFVLPTVIEGSCNAIVEAMACGLPVISSSGRFNDDLLDETMSIRIDPLDVAQIRDAIVKLRDDPALREKMAGAALARSLKFDINDRASGILKFMQSRNVG